MVITKNSIKFFADNLDFKLINGLFKRPMKRWLINKLKCKINENITFYLICKSDENIMYISIRDEIMCISITDTEYLLKYDPYQIRKEKLKKLL